MTSSRSPATGWWKRFAPRLARRPLLRLAAAGAAGAAGSAAAPGDARPATPRQASEDGFTEAVAALPPGSLALLSGADLWLVTAAADGATGTVRRRIASTSRGGWLQDPAWSPDGTRLAYVHFRWPAQPGAAGSIPWPTADVEVVRPHQALPVPVVVVRQESPTDTYGAPAWASDGQSLLVVRRRLLVPGTFVATGDLIRVWLDTGEREVVDTGFEPVEVAIRSDGLLAVVGLIDSATTGVPRETLFTLAPDGTTTPIASTDEGYEFLSFPRFAPHAPYLAFASGARERLTASAARSEPAASAGLALGATRATSTAPLEDRSITSPSGPRSTEWRRGGAAGSEAVLRSHSLTPAGRQLALARAARKLGAALTARLAPAVARAHGYRGYPWIANLEQGTVWRLPTDASDDLAGLAWIGTGNRLLCLDAAGLAFIDLDARTVGRIPGITGTAFAWSEAQ